ncbi:MAG: type VI secretion system membrane subunit TssM [Limnobacter sp.]|nr:type VI secretion system membrane subunit TssM [Limnobacter sp.]
MDMVLPVYVMITKMDTVAGFAEFFSTMDATTKAQPWGISASNDQGAKSFLNTFSQKYQAQINTLANQRTARFQQGVLNEKERALIQAFPSQMQALFEPLLEQLNTLFGENSFEQPAILRGVYFVSSTQEDHRPQWITSPFAISNSKAPPVYAGESRSYFIEGLFKKIVLPDAHLAKLGSKTAWRLRWCYGGAWAAMTLLCVGAVSAWLISQNNNRNYIQKIESNAKDYQNKSKSLLESRRSWSALLAGLNELRDLPGKSVLELKTHVNWRYGMGLYQGDKLGSEARLTYLTALERFLMQDTANLLAKQVLEFSDYAYRYEALRFYLMLHKPEHREPENLLRWIDLLLEQQGLRPDERQGLLAHISNALKNNVNLPPFDATLVDKAREELRLMPREQRVYQLLKLNYQHDNAESFSVYSALGTQADLIFDRQDGLPLTQGVPALFTYEGFHDYFLKEYEQLIERMDKEQWVLKDDPSNLTDEEIVKLQNYLYNAYTMEYTEQWKRYLGGLRIKSFQNVQEAQTVLRVLANTEQPLVTFVQAIRQHTALSELPPPPASEGIGKAVGELAAQQAKRRAGRLSGVVDKALNAHKTAEALPGQVVDDDFEDFNRYVNTDEGSSLDVLGKALSNLYQYYQRLIYDDSVVRLNARSPELVGLRQASSEAPSFVQLWFEPLIQDAGYEDEGNYRESVNLKWQSDVVAPFKLSLANQYPINPLSNKDIALEDFKAFFGPGGVVDAFFAEHLQKEVDVSRAPWRLLPTKRRVFSSSTLAFFERAKRIQNKYFSGINGGFHVTFRLTPKSLDPQVRRSTLTVMGQALSYQHDAPQSTAVVWPGESEESQLQFSLVSNSIPMSKKIVGPWSWFRLLDNHSTFSADANGDTYNVAFQIEGVEAEYTLKPGRAQHPFGEPNDLKNLSLPSRL